MFKSKSAKFYWVFPEVQNSVKCIWLVFFFRGFGKVVKQFLWLPTGEDLKVEICNVVLPRHSPPLLVKIQRLMLFTVLLRKKQTIKNLHYAWVPTVVYSQPLNFHYHAALVLPTRTARRTMCHNWVFKGCQIQPGFQFSLALSENHLEFGWGF